MGNKTIIFTTAIFALVFFSAAGFCKNLELENTQDADAKDFGIKAKQGVDMVKKYELSTTKKITFTSEHDQAKIFDIKTEDIPAFLNSLKSVFFQPGLACRCTGHYAVVFFTDKEEVKFKYAHNQNFEDRNGIYELGPDFAALVERYAPRRY